MAKERELKEAVREGRDRVSQEVFLRVIFFFRFLSFSLFFPWAKTCKHQAETDETLKLLQKFDDPWRLIFALGD